jgi:phosphoribosylaminoimidazolecarboxamide formyltransferase/IMP cyclohydrolase
MTAADPGGTPGRTPGRIAIGVSGAGSNLRALAAAADRRELGGDIVLVFGDRECPAIEWAREHGLPTVVVEAPRLSEAEARSSWDADLLAALKRARPDVIVVAGFMRVLGPAVLAAYGGRILNTHPALAPAFPGAHAVADALAAGVKVTGVTVHLVDANLDGGPIVAQEAVAIEPDEDAASLHERIKAVEHRLLPRAVALLRSEALTTDGHSTSLDTGLADRAVPVPRRALLSVSDKTGLVPFAAGLVRLGFELISTGGTAGALREAGLPVTDVAAVTGFPEMLDGRVKTLHPRIHAGLLADRRKEAHRRALAATWIAPFDVVVVNLYPFAAAASRPGIAYDELVEEIDIGGPSMVRAAAKNHANVGIVTSPHRYADVLAALEGEGRLSDGLRAALAAEAFAHTAAYDARIAAELPGRMAAAGIDLPDWPGFPGASDAYPPTLTVGLEKVETLRYGENPHQPAARYRVPGTTAADGPFATGERPLQGKALSYNNVLDATAAAAIARTFRGPGCVIVKHTNPCGVAERADLVAAWETALAADPVSAYGGIVAVNGPVTSDLARGLASVFLEVVVAPSFEPGALEILGAKANLRLVVDPGLAARDPRAPSATGSLRTAGGAVLVTAPDVLDDDPTTWQTVTRRAPTDAERVDLDLAWRLVRAVMSNAIVLVKDRGLIGMGSGQTSRVDAAAQAVAKARRFGPEGALAGAACASDAFYPFPDAVQVCLEAGVAAFVQPGGSVRDKEIIAAVDAAGAAMLLTGTRHFRH